MRLHDPLWSASLPQIHRISPGGWSNLSPVGAIFVPFPLKTGTNMLHSLSPQSLNLQYIPSMRAAAQKETPREPSRKYSHNCGVAEDRISTSRFSIPPWRDVITAKLPSILAAWPRDDINLSKTKHFLSTKFFPHKERYEIFDGENLAVEDFVTLLMRKKS